MWNFIDLASYKILEKLNEDSISLKEFVDNRIFRGVSTGCNEVFILNEDIKNSLGESNNIKKILMGKEVKRNSVEFQNTYLLFIPWDYDLNYNEKIKEYLIENKAKLEKRPEVKEGKFNWWCLSRYGSKNAHLLSEPKIIYPRINNQTNFFIDSSGEFTLSDNNFFISSNQKELLAILNSNLIFFFLKNISSTLQGGYYDFRRPYIEKVPIKSPLGKTQQLFIKKADQILSLNRELQNSSNTFIQLLQSKFNIEKLSKKLTNWYKLEFGEFLKELEKARKKVATATTRDFSPLSLQQETEWMQYFNEQKEKAQNLKSEIDQTDKEIDQMVYKLYGLTEGEIAIVEEATS